MPGDCRLVKRMQRDNQHMQRSVGGRRSCLLVRLLPTPADVGRSSTDHYWSLVAYAVP